VGRAFYVADRGPDVLLLAFQARDFSLDELPGEVAIAGLAEAAHEPCLLLV
jgi:hypothetical protein